MCLWMKQKIIKHFLLSFTRLQKRGHPEVSSQIVFLFNLNENWQRFTYSFFFIIVIFYCMIWSCNTLQWYSVILCYTKSVMLIQGSDIKYLGLWMNMKPFSVFFSFAVIFICRLLWPRTMKGRSRFVVRFMLLSVNC